MKHLLFACTACAVIGSGAVRAQQAEGLDDLPPWGVEITYECARGALMDVVYINTDDGDAFAALQIDGRLVALRITPAASGAKFAQGEGGYVLWSKGEEANVYYGPDEEPVLSDCIARASG